MPDEPHKSTNVNVAPITHCTHQECSRNQGQQLRSLQVNPPFVLTIDQASESHSELDLRYDDEIRLRIQRWMNYQLESGSYPDMRSEQYSPICF